MSNDRNPDDDLDDLDDLVGFDDDAVPSAARDEDEQAADELLEVDQAELEALGLVLDDPHQAEEE